MNYQQYRHSSMANRGMPFEKMIEMQNDLYRESGVAIIDKQNTKFIPIRNRSGQIVSCKVDEKATVDFIGKYGHYPIAFEAKHNAGDTMRFDRVQLHQQSYLDDWSMNGDIAFVAVNFGFESAFIIPWVFFKEAIQTRQTGEKNREVEALGMKWITTGKASFRKDELLPQWKVPIGGHAVFDYMSVVKRLWNIIEVKS